MKRILFIFLFIQTQTIISQQENNFIHQALNTTDDAHAICLLQKAIAHNPRSYKGLFFLANQYCKYGVYQHAIACYKKMITHTPHSAQLHHNLGYNLKIAGYLDDAIESYKHALQIDPNYFHSEFACALTYLQKGDFENGWQWYNPYLKKNNLYAEQLRTWIINKELKGKTILLRKQGGFGDTMQFVRYAQVLHEMDAHVIVQESKPMLKLLSLCPYIDTLIPTKHNVPNHDDQTSLMALPAIFNSNEKTIPKNIPYLFADKTLVEYWKKKLPKPGIKIGYCFIADLKNDESRLPIAHRSVPLELLQKLQTSESIYWYNLHKDSTDFGDDFDKNNGAFMDTAAIIENLDLVITVDTSIAHLAGALGKPVWLLLPFSTDWRWIHGRTDSPWYPTIKIFKQKTPFDWKTVIEHVAQALKELYEA